MKGGKGDKVGFFLRRIGWCESQKGVADLLYVDCARKGSFLSVVTLQLKDRFSTLGIGEVEAAFLPVHCVRRSIYSTQSLVDGD